MSPPLYFIADIGVLWNGFGLRSHNIVGLFQVSITRLGLGRASAPRGAGDRVVVVIVDEVEQGAVVGLVVVVVGLYMVLSGLVVGGGEHSAVVGETVGIKGEHAAVLHDFDAVEGVKESSATLLTEQ